MGTQWFRGQLGLALQQRLTLRRSGRHRVGVPGGIPERTGAPSRRMRHEMSPDVKDRVFKRILLIYKITLPQD